MAVLKRGDKLDTFTLSSARRLATSFAWAWNLMWQKAVHMFRTQWVACVVCGLIGVVWLCVYCNTVFWHFDSKEMALNLVAGALILVIWSVMRAHQLELLDDDAAEDNKPKRGAIKGFWHSLQKGAMCSVPLLLAWVLTYVVAYILITKEAQPYVLYPSITLAVVLLFPLAGMLQSNAEISTDRYLTAMHKGLKLIAHYWGGMAAMFVISLVVLVLMACVLFFGEVIIAFAFRNRSVGLFMGEEVEIPATASWLRYGIMFFCTAIISFFQMIWSLPQQVHIRSLLYKAALRQQRKNKSQSDESDLTADTE